MFDETAEDTNRRLKDAVYFARELRKALAYATWGLDDEPDMRGRIESLCEEAEHFSQRIEHRRRSWAASRRRSGRRLRNDQGTRI